jgi:hypothetical protein
MKLIYLRLSLAGMTPGRWSPKCGSAAVVVVVAQRLHQANIEKI